MLSAEGEFTSALWPFMAQGRGVEVRTVPLGALAEAVDARTDVVAFSAVQSSDGAAGRPRRDRGGGRGITGR